MGHATAECILESFEQALLEIPFNKIVQVSMDGPAVNWKFIDLLQSVISERTNNEKKLLNVGSFGLHTIHEAFQHGHKASGWSVNSYL